MKLRNKDGSLTNYGLTCGYVQEKYNKDNSKRIQLIKDGGSFHVRGFDFYNHKKLCWEVFSSLTEAKKFYKHFKFN